MPKYKIKTLALLLALPFIITACTLQDLPLVGSLFSGRSKPVELTVWGLWEKDYILEPVFRMYQQEYPNVTFNYQDMSVLKLADLVEYKARVFTRMEEKEWDADVVMVHNSWVPRLVAMGLVDAMPASLLGADVYADLFYPSAAQSAVFGSDIYAIPFFYEGLVLVYNKDHFEEAEVVTPPTGWEEFRRTAIDLTVLSDDIKPEILRAGAAIGGADNIGHFSDILGLMWTQAGVDIPRDIDSVAAQDALTFYTDLLKEHDIWSDKFPEATTAFVNGQVSMIFVPTWQILDILEARPDLNIGVAPVPQALPDSPASWASFWMYAVPANSDSKAAAWNFINFLTTEEAELALYDEASKVRSFGSAHALTDLDSELISNSYLGPLLRSAPYAYSGEIAARAGNRRQVEALEKAVNDVLSGASVKEALEEAKEAVDK